MANYRFKTAEIEAMKKNILTHCKYEREPDRHGNKSAWRLRLVLEGYVMCCRCSKREEARRLRELALYEKLTENDLPNWQDEPTQPATPTETPQISTETAEAVNVSAEGEKEAERAEIAITSITQLSVLKYKLQHPKLKEWAVKYGLLDLVRNMYCAPELSLGGLWIDNKFRQSLCENDKAIIAAVRKLIADAEKAA